MEQKIKSKQKLKYNGVYLPAAKGIDIHPLLNLPRSTKYNRLF